MPPVCHDAALKGRVMPRRHAGILPVATLAAVAVLQAANLATPTHGAPTPAPTDPRAAWQAADAVMKPDNPGPAANFDLQQIGDGVYAVIRKDPPGLMCDGNSLIIVNDDDVVVVDSPESTHAMIAALRRLTPKPVKYVINTHWHDDHITGNQLFKDAFPGVEFIAHAAVREYLPTTGAANRKQMIEGAPQGVEMLRKLLAQSKSLSGADITPEERASYTSDIALVEQYLAVVPGSPMVLPTVAVEESLTLYRGRRTIEIRHLGRSHTSGDLVVFLPQDRIVAAGDLVIWPVPLVGGEQSHIADWAASLDRLRALQPAIIVPGHGPVLRDETYVRMMGELFTSIATQTAAAVARGKTLDETRKMVNLDEFKNRFGGDSQLRRVLFSYYVTGPGVTAAYRDASPRS